MGVKRYRAFLLSGLLAFVASCATPKTERPSVKESVSGNRILLYGKFETTLKVDAAYSNPFDPQDISVDVVFTSPTGVKKVCPAFLYSSASGSGSRDEWRVRFSPDEEGTWTWRVKIVDDGKTTESEAGTMDCISSTNRGPIKVSTWDPRFFAFDSEAPFYPIGHNVCWNTLEEYREQFVLMAENGENWSRVWIAPWNCEFEWSSREGYDYRGLGRYNLDNARKLDGILEAAESNGLYLQLVLHEHCRLSAMTNPEWQNNPYNSALGGPCAMPRDFFIDKEARRLAKNRLRYIVARWGYSSHVMAWELFNEVDLTDEFSFDRDTPWHREMAAFLKKTDPHGHLVTTSYMSAPNAETLKLPEIDYTQSHVYAEDIDRFFLRFYEPYASLGKPHFIGEFGRHAADGVDAQDRDGSFLHAGLWAQFMIPDAGNAMSWWWYDHIHPHHLYPAFAALSRFSKDVTRNCGDWQIQTGQFQSDSGTAFHVIAMAISAKMVCWIYDPSVLPWREKRPRHPPEIAGRLQVESVLAGTWAAEQWDTYKGTITRKQEFTVTDGTISFDVQSPGPDTAIKFTRLDDTPTENKRPRLVLKDWTPLSNSSRVGLRIPSVSTPIVIDGDIGDWAFADAIRVNPTDGRSPSDNSFSFKVLHDGDTLFVAVQVADDHLVRQNSVGGSLWKDDGVEIWIDSLYDAGFFNNLPHNPGCYQINVAPALKDGPADHVVYRNPAWNDKTLPAVVAQSRLQPGGGYTIEVKIPLPALRGTVVAKSPRLIGFNISVCDSDPAKGSNEWRHLLWQGRHEWDAEEWSIGVLK